MATPSLSHITGVQKAPPVTINSVANAHGSSGANVSVSELASGRDVLNFKGHFNAVFDPSTNTSERTIGVHLIGPLLPAGLKIMKAWTEVQVAFTSATNAGTVGIGSGFDGANVADLVIGTAVSGAPYSTISDVICLPTGSSLTGVTAKSTAADRQLRVEVLVEALLTGRVIVHCEYEIAGA